MPKSTLTLFSCFWAVLLVIVSLEPIYSLEANSSQAQASRVKKRSYFPWSLPRTSSYNSLSLYNAAKIFKPAAYAIARPYYIPVYGLAGGSLIFYPPQPFYINPGIPKDNPANPPYQAPAYLPPTTAPTQVADRLGGFNEDDDAPIWGVVGQAPLNGGSNQEYDVVPTRPPSALAANRPPLLHGSADNEAQPKENRQETETRPQRPPAPAGPSNCVWAIVSCCSSADPNSLPQNCFEQRGCPGPFWGRSPCSSDFARAAVQAAVNYYNSNPAGK